jgi:hypothetical protein
MKGKTDTGDCSICKFKNEYVIPGTFQWSRGAFCVIIRLLNDPVSTAEIMYRTKWNDDHECEYVRTWNRVLMACCKVLF